MYSTSARTHLLHMPVERLPEPHSDNTSAIFRVADGISRNCFLRVTDLARQHPTLTMMNLITMYDPRVVGVR